MIAERIFPALLLSAFLTSIAQSAPQRQLINLGHQSGYFQGDLKLPAKQRNGILKADRWTDGIVYYELGEFNAEQKSMIQEGMQAIQKSTCIRYVPRTDQPNYVVIKNTNGGCYSTAVGMERNVQYISLQDTEGGPSCFSHGTIVHELLHATGLWHEQMRYDRDDYITINWDNIKNTSSMRWQFQKVLENKSSTYGIPYNYRSVMHYDAWSGGNGSAITMDPKDKSMLYVMGSRSYGDELDWEKIRRMYECKGKFTPAPTTQAPCIDEYNDCAYYLDKCGIEGWLVGSCRKSCGFCDGKGGTGTRPPTTKATPAPCVDTFNECSTYLDKCNVEGWMKGGCRKSCGFCEGGGTQITGAPTAKPAPAPGPCKDDITYCASYLSICEKEEWMARACKKSCKMC